MSGTTFEAETITVNETDKNLHPHGVCISSVCVGRQINISTGGIYNMLGSDKCYGEK